MIFRTSPGGICIRSLEGRCFSGFLRGVKTGTSRYTASPTAKFRRSAVSLLFPRSQTSFFFGDMAFSWESLGDLKGFPKYLAMSWQLSVCTIFFSERKVVYRPFWASAFQNSFWNLYFWKSTSVDRVELGRIWEWCFQNSKMFFFHFFPVRKHTFWLFRVCFMPCFVKGAF